MTARTMSQKIWDAHVVRDLGDGAVLLYIDRHLINEVTSPQAFEGLRAAGRQVRNPHSAIAVTDHNVPTNHRSEGIAGILDTASRLQVETLEVNAAAFGIPYIPLVSRRQGIVHVIGPELGFTLPGTTIVCGDSHTSTHGAFGALAFGIGTSEIEHVLATQMLVQAPFKSMLVRFEGALGAGMSAKDMILALIGRIGTAGANGHVIEYAGEAVRALDMAGRMTLCNMSIEAGARAGMIAPDDTTYAYLEGRPMAPRGQDWLDGRRAWDQLASDPNARFDTTVTIDATSIAPMISWGTSPEAVVPIHGLVPDPNAQSDPLRRQQYAAMQHYMGLIPGTPMRGLAIDTVFIGSCTNGRLEDLRAAAALLRGRRIASGVRALVVPGSGQVKAEAEAEGLDRIFVDAGFDWRDPGCSMCLGMNPDKLQPGSRCASTSNRNFEGRQGPGGRTHLMSPAMAAAAALAGCIADSREYLR